MRKNYDILSPETLLSKELIPMIFERTVAEIAGDYAVLVSESGTRTEVALALLPDGIREGTVLICENFEYRIKML